MFCKHCGKQIPDGTLSCQFCGKNPAGDEPAQPTDYSQSATYGAAAAGTAATYAQPQQQAYQQQAYAQQAYQQQAYAQPQQDAYAQQAYQQQAYAQQQAYQQAYAQPQQAYAQPQQQAYQQQAYQQQAYQQAYQQPAYNAGIPYAQPNQCMFDGTGGEYWKLNLTNSFLTFITLGIYSPWAMCKNIKWRNSHTILNGRRLAFTGTGGELFGKWIVWYLLSVITCGIYGIFMHVKTKEWEMEHTCYADLNPVDGQTFADSFYDGTTGSYMGVGLVVNLLMTITCGIYAPWGVVKKFKYDTEHEVINGDRLSFSGTGGEYYGENSMVNILNYVTCGIYRPWGICAMNRWFYKNTSIASRGNVKGY